MTQQIMKINSNKKVEASDSDGPRKAIPTKISIFYKPNTARFFSSLVLVLSILTTPIQAHAGFFSFVEDLFGNTTFALDEVSNDMIHNSQNIPLMESSLTTELKPGSDDADVTIVGDQALESVTGPMGTDADLNGYSGSDSRINIYIVKKGDTIDSIAKENKVSKASILYANSDIESNKLTQEGTVLVIIPLEGASYVVKKGDTLGGISNRYGISVSDILEYNLMDKGDSLKVGQTLILVGVKSTTVTKVDKPKTTSKKPTTKSASPDQMVQSGKVPGGYIWPFPAGIGRVSQGMHDGQAYDFAAPKGTPIYAIQDGVVLTTDSSGYNGGYGLYVVVNFNDGKQAIFAHMSKVASHAGQVVKKGDVIGYVGSTGRSTGPHVHIEFKGGSTIPYRGLPKNATSYSIKD